MHKHRIKATHLELLNVLYKLKSFQPVVAKWHLSYIEDMHLRNHLGW